MPWVGGINNAKSIITQSILDELDKQENNIVKTSKTKVQEYIDKTQAIDTGTLKSSITTSYIKKPKSRIIKATVQPKPYSSKNPTPANYTASKKPPFAPPKVSKKQTTILVAIMIMWGLGVHKAKGPRNFLGEGLLDTAKALGLKDRTK